MHILVILLVNTHLTLKWAFARLLRRDSTYETAQHSQIRPYNTPNCQYHHIKAPDCNHDQQQPTRRYPQGKLRSASSRITAESMPAGSIWPCENFAEVFAEVSVEVFVELQSRWGELNWTEVGLGKIKLASVSYAARRSFIKDANEDFCSAVDFC